MKGFKVAIFLFVLIIQKYGVEGCICPDNYKPYCGTDEVTYSNLCRLECARARVKFEGVCAVPYVESSGSSLKGNNNNYNNNRYQTSGSKNVPQYIQPPRQNYQTPQKYFTPATERYYKPTTERYFTLPTERYYKPTTQRYFTPATERYYRPTTEGYIRTPPNKKYDYDPKQQRPNWAPVYGQ